MKKILLTALFLGAFVTANAVEVEVEVKEDCHAYACGKVGEFEDEYGDRLSFDTYEWIYDTFMNVCEN